jgi:hypothetical protein
MLQDIFLKDEVSAGVHADPIVADIPESALKWSRVPCQ